MFCWPGAGLGRNNKERDRKMIAAGRGRGGGCVLHVTVGQVSDSVTYYSISEKRKDISRVSIYYLQPECADDMNK